MTPLQLRKAKSTIMWRQFDGQEPENYGYRVCEGRAAKHIQRARHAVWKSKRLMDWDFNADCNSLIFIIFLLKKSNIYIFNKFLLFFLHFQSLFKIIKNNF